MYFVISNKAKETGPWAGLTGDEVKGGSLYTHHGNCKSLMRIPAELIVDGTVLML